MIDKNLKTLGFKDMHEDQVAALLGFISSTLSLVQYLDDEEISEEVAADADELVRLFGGDGVMMKRAFYL